MSSPDKFWTKFFALSQLAYAYAASIQNTNKILIVILKYMLAVSSAHFFCASLLLR